jgi:Holliday junction resolvase RusA-like endonuclease
MKKKTYKQQIEEYKERFGLIPDDPDKILSYLEETLHLTESDFKKIEEENAYAAGIPWESLKIVLPIIPKPSPRPRLGANSHFYVTGAAENKKLFKYYIEEVYRIIYTQTYFSLTTYMPTPISSMNRREVYRAEMKSITPTSNPDWDNLGKTYSDMIQSILILNDNIISKGNVEKFYSVKPRVEINIKYQLGYDSRYNKRRIQSSKAYKEAIETGHIIEIYTEGSDIW